MDARKPKLVHPLLGYICGMCSDELPYGQIADKVLEAKGYAHDLEAQLAGAVGEAVAIMRAARGHYGIEETGGPGQPATEWDEIADRMQMFVYRYGGQ